MSIKSDRWIHRMSAQPTHVLELDGEKHFFNHRYDKAEIENIGGMRFVTDADLADWKPMIAPYCGNQVRNKKGKDIEVWDGIAPTHERVISYGVSSYGYDVRVADEFKIFTNVNSGVVDPKNFDEKNYIDFKGPELIIPPNGFALARTVEYMRIPRDVLVICLGKSTYARCGIIVNVTPLEPEWEGHVTLEFSNTTNLPAKIYANEGIAQFLFLQGDEDCDVSYKDKGGKYQGQTGVVTPRM